MIAAGADKTGLERRPPKAAFGGFLCVEDDRYIVYVRTGGAGFD